MIRIIDCNQVFNLYSSREIVKSFITEYYVFQVQSIKYGQGYSTIFLEKNLTLDILNDIIKCIVIISTNHRLT